MIEAVEFRITEEDALKYLGASAGERIGLYGWVRRIIVRTSDPLFDRIGQLERDFHSQGEVFILSWSPVRRYSTVELRKATLLQLVCRRFFEPCGEECGTEYDERTACPHCGAGAQQVSSLRLSRRAIARLKSADIAKSTGGEIVVSSRFRSLCLDAQAEGLCFEPIVDPQRNDSPIEGWHQLRVLPPEIDVGPSSRVGITPFDDDPNHRFRCVAGDTAGLNLISELFVSQSDYQGADLAATRQFVGNRQGILRPEKLLLLSGRLHELLQKYGVKGYAVEVAHLE